jgi:hypothetical protein
MSDQAKKNKELNAQMGQALFNDIERMEMWYSSNWKRFAVYAVSAACLVAIVFGVYQYITNSNKKSSYALADATTQEELVKVLAANPNHPGAALARFRLAKILIDSAKYADAIKELTTLTTNANTDASLKGSALLSLAFCQELNGKTSDAAKAFKSLGNDIQYNAAIRAEAKYHAARLLIKDKKFDEAATLLKSIPQGKSQITAFWSSNAEMLLTSLEAGDFGKYTPKKQVK